MLIKITRHLELVIQLEGMQCFFSAENLIKLTQFEKRASKTHIKIRKIAEYVKTKKD